MRSFCILSIFLENLKHILRHKMWVPNYGFLRNPSPRLIYALRADMLLFAISSRQVNIIVDIF